MPSVISCDAEYHGERSKAEPLVTNFVDPRLLSSVNSPLTGKKKPKPRSNFTAHQRQLLEQFFYDHWEHPYADRRDLEALERATNLSKKQIRVFMTNARMRKFAGLKQVKLRVKGSGRSGDPDDDIENVDQISSESENESESEKE
jgi:hypothetical protein